MIKIKGIRNNKNFKEKLKVIIVLKFNSTKIIKKTKLTIFHIIIIIIIIITSLKCPKVTISNSGLIHSDRSMKILLIGNSGVGKSNLLTRFAVPSPLFRKTNSLKTSSTPLESISYLCLLA